ncbi:hypothetical protein [Sphingomonas bacterium]|nr:hypothetical protein [Sphingomonas bacterium]
MADPHSDRPIHLDTDDARGGATTHVTRYVLAASLVLVIVAFIAIYYIY